VVVVPEFMNSVLTNLPADIPKVSFIQNAFYALHTSDFREDHAYDTAKNVLACIVVSQQNLELLKFAFPERTFVRIHVSVDHATFYLSDKPPEKRIAYMSRKLSRDSKILLNILRSRGALDGWDVVEIDQMSESDVARVLRSTTLFLSFCEQEGSALPPIEALASGCRVIGYPGFGTGEYFVPPDATSVAEGDVASFAHEVGRWLDNFRADAHWRGGRSRSERIFTALSREQEKAEVISLWLNVLSEIPPSRGLTHVIKRSHMADQSVSASSREIARYVRERRAGHAMAVLWAFITSRGGHSVSNVP
jgi:hypothetical protein